MPFTTVDRITATSVPWLWPGRLPIGHLVMLDGDPGLGKSMVTLDLCARISTGRPFPDGAAGGDPAAVIFLNAEDGAHDTIPGRLRAAGADLARVQIFERAPDESFLRLPGHVARLEQAVARSGARYVVIDPITAFLDTDVNVASDVKVRAALAPLADLAARHRCVIQMVRHLNKGRGANPLYRGLYSIGFIASCRVSWLIARDPRRSRRFVLAQSKTNLDAPQTSLAYTIEPTDTGFARIAWHGPSTFNDTDLLAAAPSRLRLRQRAEEFLLDFLKDGPRSTRDIWPVAEQLRFSKRTLERAREALKISFSRTHVGKPEQTCYWLLPDQQFTPEISDMPELDEQLHKLGEQNALRTPIDVEDRLEYFKFERDEDSDEEDEGRETGAETE